MHIPTEILYIFLRNAGITLKKRNNTYTDIQVFSCSRCGICLDRCQMSVAGINDSQSVYLLKSIRNKKLSDEQLFNCLMCGKCQNDCPVGIKTNDLRIIQRIESTLQYNSSYHYLNEIAFPKTEVVYFAGCMTHLTPGIIKSMKKIFQVAGINYLFIDEDKSPCCGRPLMMAGQFEAASKLIENNTANILSTGAKTLVVSCPICYKVFKEDYALGNVQVIFYTDYIPELIKKKKINVATSDRKFVYHDPCELGRGMGIYSSPRQLLNKTGKVIPIKNEKEDAHCCGGSLGNLKISQENRNVLRNLALEDYSGYTPDMLVTACPKCKKTFAAGRILPVFDIAEVVMQSMEKATTGKYSETIDIKEKESMLI
ncbi:MAG: (Fe-S)-binding protein [Mariniphaga sp.]